MFWLCESMKWNHLPVAGGIYDQHPGLLEKWEFMFSERAKYEREQEEKEKAKRQNEQRRAMNTRRRAR